MVPKIKPEKCVPNVLIRKIAKMKSLTDDERRQFQPYGSLETCQNPFQLTLGQVHHSFMLLEYKPIPGPC